jgi:hypothetical protein
VGNAVGRHVDDFGAVDLDGAGAFADQPQNRLERGRASGPVAAKQGNHLAFPQSQIEAMENVGFAVPGVKILDFEHFRALIRLHRWFPCRLP